jgi:plastocyanin
MPTTITSSLDKITWTNNDSQPHTVMSGENAEADGRFDSGILAPTRTFEHTFTQPGQHPYLCNYIHIWLEQSEQSADSYTNRKCRH